jgi:hypothetical protein
MPSTGSSRAMAFFVASSCSMSVALVIGGSGFDVDVDPGAHRRASFADKSHSG